MENYKDNEGPGASLFLEKAERTGTVQSQEDNTE